MPESLRLDEEAGPAPPAPVRRADAAPGETGLWVFVLGDMTVFGLFFVVFLVEARADRDGFAAAARELLTAVGLINTLVLLCSSYLVVLAIEAHRRSATTRAAALVLGVIACAVAFAALKVVEYAAEIGEGHTPRSAPFFTFYFVITGLHLLHVLIGTVLLARWRDHARRGLPWAELRRFVEGTAVYWHMVDLLWIVIFTLLYLVVRS